MKIDYLNSTKKRIKDYLKKRVNLERDNFEEKRNYNLY